MQIFEFKQEPFSSLYNEFLCSTEYIHSVKKWHDDNKKKDPYTPSLFIYSYFTFNTLYNINWNYTSQEFYSELYHYGPKEYKDGKPQYYSEKERINLYLDFLTNIHGENFLNEFRDNFISYIRNYRRLIDKRRNIKRDDNYYDITRASWVIDYLKKFEAKAKTKLDECAKKDLLEITNAILDNSVLNISTDGFKRLVEIIYSVRCNLFHGSKDPWNFENGQNERFVIYAAVLSSLNYMLFLHLSTVNKNR